MTASICDLEWQREFFRREFWRRTDVPSRLANASLGNFNVYCPEIGQIKTRAQTYIDDFSDKVSTGFCLAGSTGCGKTHLAAGILRGIVDQGFMGRYCSAPKLFADIRSTFNSNDSMGLTEADIVDDLCEAKVLVLDDIGGEKLSEFVVNVFYNIIDNRYWESNPLIITTNYNRTQLKQRLGNRILSRLTEMCPSIGKFPNIDYRTKEMKL